MANDALHTGLPAVLSMENIADGGVYELMGDALKKLAANIADPNTDPIQKRKIILTIEAKPFKDRSGAELQIKVDNRHAGFRSIESRMYVAQSPSGEYLAFGRKTKQTEIEFAAAATVVDHSGPPVPPKKAN